MDAFFAAVEERRDPELRGRPVVIGADPKAGKGRGVVAKIASDFRKPDGLTVVLPEAVEDFLDPLSIRVIPGIGPKTEAFLRERGIGTIAELRGVERPRLVEWLGKWGDDVYERARGVSLSPVSNQWERKSVAEQETFEQDTLDRSFVRDG